MTFLLIYSIIHLIRCLIISRHYNIQVATSELTDMGILKYFVFLLGIHLSKTKSKLFYSSQIHFLCFDFRTYKYTPWLSNIKYRSLLTTLKRSENHLQNLFAHLQISNLNGHQRIKVIESKLKIQHDSHMLVQPSCTISLGQQSLSLKRIGHRFILKLRL